jgi:hypothetical protein
VLLVLNGQMMVAIASIITIAAIIQFAIDCIIHGIVVFIVVIISHYFIHIG